MYALILAGGRGRRLGALTTNHPKAMLRFAGKSLLSHILTTVVEIDVIQHVFVATGYLHETVKHTAEKEAENLPSRIPITILSPEIKLEGAFKSTVRAFQKADIARECLVIGIDVIVTETAITSFVHKVQRGRTTFVVSPLLTLAPTHGRIRLGHSGKIAEYRKAASTESVSGEDWYCDVGVRYFSASFVKECLSLKLTGYCDYDDIIPDLIGKGVDLHAYILKERWLHFAVSKDFSQKPLLNKS
jgi:NDP-sugar pyrophosphorylase family protein